MLFFKPKGKNRIMKKTVFCLVFKSVQTCLSILLIVFCLASMASCQETDENSLCESRDLRPDSCDIREETCRQNTFCLVKSVRDSDMEDPPPVWIISKEEYREDLLLQASPETDESKHFDEVLSLLNLLTPVSSASDSVIEDSVENTLAFYSHGQKDVTIIDQGASGDLSEEVWTLAHEFVHACQDYDYDLTSFYADFETFDDTLAASSLVEGEAMLYSELVYFLIEDIDSGSVSWNNRYEQLMSYVIESVEFSDSPLITAISSVPYPVGENYVARVWLIENNDGVGDLWETLPRTMAEWMNGYNSAPIDSSSFQLPFPAPVAPEGFEAMYADQLGAVGLFALLVGLDMDGYQAWSNAKSWRHDGFWTFADFQDDRHAVVWTIGWSTRDEATAFKTFVEQNPHTGDWKVEISDTETSLLVSSDPEVLEAWTYQNVPAMTPRTSPMADFIAPPKLTIPGLL
jgi:hypothetical protein